MENIEISIYLIDCIEKHDGESDLDLKHSMFISLRTIQQHFQVSVREVRSYLPIYGLPFVASLCCSVRQLQLGTRWFLRDQWVEGLERPGRY